MIGVIGSNEVSRAVHCHGDPLSRDRNRSNRGGDAGRRDLLQLIYAGGNIVAACVQCQVVKARTGVSDDRAAWLVLGDRARVERR